MEYLQYISFSNDLTYLFNVLNLVINGIPSILLAGLKSIRNRTLGFKPCYKWNTFNTLRNWGLNLKENGVLNLVINGIPSILLLLHLKYNPYHVLNLVINGIPSIHLKSESGRVHFSEF